MREDISSGPKSFKSSRSHTRITAVMAIREDEYDSSSSLEGKKKKEGTRFKRQNKTPTTVAPIIQQKRARDNRLPEISGYGRLYFMIGHQAEEFPAVSLQVRLTPLQQHENNKDNIPHNRNWLSPLRRSPYYLDLINPSHDSSSEPTLFQSSIILVQYTREGRHQADRRKNIRLRVHSTSSREERPRPTGNLKEK